MTTTEAEYFSQSQLPSQQYVSHCETSIISVEAIGQTHPYFAEMKKHPKNHPNSYFSVQLSTTVAFPVGGGQASDKGVIIVKNKTAPDDKKVYHIEAVYRINNLIQHVISVPKDVSLVTLFTPDYLNNVTITMYLDMDRRFFNMHNHTAQHLLSAIFSQLFQCDTFGWTSGVYNPTPIRSIPFSNQNWELIQGSISTIDFTTTDLDNVIKHLSLVKIIKFLIFSLEKHGKGNDFKFYPFSLFMTKVFSIIYHFFTPEQMLKYNEMVLDCVDYDSLLELPLDTILGPDNDGISITFEHLALSVENIANFIMTLDHPVDVHIEGVIESTQDSNDPERTTTSMGSTTSTVDHDGGVIRQNVQKFSKYGKNGAVPKRFISIGIEKSPCCGTHVDNLSKLQSVTILNAFKHGGRWRISFTPAISTLPVSHWSFSLIDQLKTKFSCQVHEVSSFVEKNVTLASGIKHYKSKIYQLLGNSLMQQYLDKYNSNQSTHPDTASDIIIHYNDSFFATPDDLTATCYAMSEACNAIGVSHRPILILTNNAANSAQNNAAGFSNPGIFLVYGSTETANQVKTLGGVVGESLGIKGGGRPGLFQGKTPQWDGYDTMIEKLKNNTIGWEFIGGE
jgi:Ser-tRNA(Ala) deacylase AlaX